MYTYFIFIVLLPDVFSQYAIDTGMRPDVRFDGRNERFDISALMDPGEYVEGYRRQGGQRAQKVHYNPNQNTRNILRLINKNLGGTVSPSSNAMVPKLVQLLRHMARRAGQEKSGDWAWHDDMKGMENQNNYERNLEKFRAESRRDLVEYLHDRPELSRRSNVEPDKEVLLHHAVPIVMNVQGFLKSPSDTLAK